MIKLLKTVQLRASVLDVSQTSPQQFSWFGPKLGPSGHEETKVNDAGEESESDQCQSDEYEAYDTDEEEVDKAKITLKPRLVMTRLLDPIIPRSHNRATTWKITSRDFRGHLPFAATLGANAGPIVPVHDQEIQLRGGQMSLKERRMQERVASYQRLLSQPVPRRACTDKL